MIRPLFCPLIKFFPSKGEANTGNIRELERYGCSFKNLIGEWRRVWSENTNTNSNFPFGFVQLSQVKENQAGIGYQMIRWYQTDGYGYVPNESLEVYFEFSRSVFC